MRSVPANGRPRRRRFQAASGALAVVLAAGLLAGCGGGSSDSSSAADGDGSSPSPTAPALPADQPQRRACELVTQAEVEAAVGARVSPGRQDNQEARSLCAFSLVATPDQSVALISTSSSGVPAAFDAARANAESPQTVNAGDQAFVTGGQAVVRKGTTMVAILVVLRQQPAQLAPVATKLAQAVGNRL